MIAFLRALAPAALADGPRAQPVFAPRLATAGTGDSAMAAVADVARPSTRAVARGTEPAAASARPAPAEPPPSPRASDPTESEAEYRPVIHHPAEPSLPVRPGRAGRDERQDSGKPAQDAALLDSGASLPYARPPSRGPASRLEAPIATPRPAIERGRTGGAVQQADPAPLRTVASAASATPLADAVVATRVDRATSSGAARTVVQVSIDRIDIRAPQEPKPAARPARASVASAAALGDWLRGSEAGKPAHGGRP